MIYLLSKKEPGFPPLEESDENGLLAIGGDLGTERLKAAYSSGIFPWYQDGQPILWWSPDPRMVLYPDKLKVSHSLKQTIKSRRFQVTFDREFARVIDSCSQATRSGQDGTWITKEMKNAYIRLHKAGLAHSVETWLDGELAGGLYGVSLGGIFCGESMFHSQADASKVAFYYLVEKLKKWSFEIIDAQVFTSHLQSLGGELIDRKRYVEILNKALEKPGKPGLWNEELI